MRPVVIDPAHGGSDIGDAMRRKQAGLHVREKDLVLSVGMVMAAYLVNAGRDAVLTRTSDVCVPVRERIAWANEQKPILVVSLHTSHTRGEVEVFYADQQPVKYHKKIVGKIKELGMFGEVYVEEGGSDMLVKTYAPALEVGLGLLAPGGGSLHKLALWETQMAMGVTLAEGVLTALG